MTTAQQAIYDFLLEYERKSCSGWIEDRKHSEGVKVLTLVLARVTEAEAASGPENRSQRWLRRGG